MLTLSKTQQIIIGIALMLLVIVTRGHHFASLNNLPSASLTVFFLAGLYLRPTLMFPALLALCTGLDLYSVYFQGVSNFCVTPAYSFLLPAYGSMWLAGRWFAKHYSFTLKAIFPLIGSVSIAGALSELFSSGGFYFFGGRYPDPTITEFGARLIKYAPRQFENIGFWLAVAAIIHITFVLANNFNRAKA